MVHMELHPGTGLDPAAQIASSLRTPTGKPHRKKRLPLAGTIMQEWGQHLILAFVQEPQFLLEMRNRGLEFPDRGASELTLVPCHWIDPRLHHVTEQTKKGGRLWPFHALQFCDLAIQGRLQLSATCLAVKVCSAQPAELGLGQHGLGCSIRICTCV